MTLLSDWRERAFRKMQEMEKKEGCHGSVRIVRDMDQTNCMGNYNATAGSFEWVNGSAVVVLQEV